jgi:hypothetical protein
MLLLIVPWGAVSQIHSALSDAKKISILNSPESTKACIKRNLNSVFMFSCRVLLLEELLVSRIEFTIRPVAMKHITKINMSLIHKPLCESVNPITKPMSAWPPQKMMMITILSFLMIINSIQSTTFSR